MGFSLKLLAMSWPVFHSFFYHRVTRLALFISLGIGILFAQTVWTMRSEHWDYYLRTNTNLSSTLAKGLEWSLDAVDTSLQKTVIALQEVQFLEEAAFRSDTQLAAIDNLWRDMTNSNVLVLDRQGRVVHRTQDTPSVGKQFLGHDFFQAFSTQNHQGVFIGQPTQDLVMGEYVLPIAHKVQGQNSLLAGVVVGTLRMQEINAWLSGMNLGVDSGINVIRTDGLVITRFPYKDMKVHPSLAGSSNLMRFVSTPQGNFVGTAVLDGVERLYTHQRVGHYPLVVNVAQSTRNIFSAWQHHAWQLGFFAALLMLGCLGLAWMFGRELVRRERTESALFTEKERMRLTLQSMGDAVVCTDAQGLITYLNPVARQIAGVELSEVQHQPIEVLHRLKNSEGTESETTVPLRHALNTRRPIARMRTQYVHQYSGAMVEMEETANLVHSLDGHILGAVVIARDVTTAAAHEARMRRLAFHDALTGLPNRLLLEDRAQQAMALCKRMGKKLAVVYLDLDGFKQINDSLGHQAGDAAIVHAANCLSACVRASDTVCRLGGDEFVLLLPDLADVHHVHNIIEKIQQAGTQPLVWRHQNFVLRFSGGVAVYPEHAHDWQALLHCADSAMYAAKQSGRHQIRLYQVEKESSLLTQTAVPACEL